MNNLPPVESETGRAPCVGDAMTTRGALIPPWFRMGAARRIAALKRVRHLFVEDGRKLAGMLDSRSLDSAADGDPVSAHVRSVATVLTPATSAVRALDAMARTAITGLPVVSGGFLIGLVTQQALHRVVRRARAGQAPRAATRAPAAMATMGMLGSLLVPDGAGLNP